MRWIILVLSLIAFGCTERPEPPKEEPVKTRPNLPRRQKRMIAQEEVKKPKIVVVIDSGFTFPKEGKTKLCKYGHKNFSNNKEATKPEGFKSAVPLDNHGHGTNIVGLIEQYAGDANYCIVILKYFDPKVTGLNNLASVEAFEYAIDINADYINYSGGGVESSYQENKLVKEFLNKGGKIIAAAGNEKSDIDLKDKHFFPAMADQRVIVVGNAIRLDERIVKRNALGFDIEDEETKMKKEIFVGNEQAYPAESSNYGYRVNRWEYGTNQVGLYGTPMTGTSQATAIVTGKILKSECDK